MGRLKNHSKRHTKIYLFGGIGNQFFQSLYAQKFSNYQKTSVLHYDYCFHNGFKVTHNSFLHDIFDISVTGVGRFSPKISRAYFIVANFSARCGFGYINDNAISLSNQKIAFQNYYKLLGYFQENWFGNEFSEFSQLFIKNHINAECIGEVGKKNEYLNGIGVHVRGGDFLTSAAHNICNVDYYCDAIKRMRRLVGNLKCYIITDDEDYAKSLISATNIENFEILENSDPREAILLLSAFPNRILSNSTFSILASEIGCWKCKYGYVYAPKCLTSGKVRKFKLTNELDWT